MYKSPLLSSHRPLWISWLRSDLLVNVDGDTVPLFQFNCKGNEGVDGARIVTLLEVHLTFFHKQGKFNISKHCNMKLLLQLIC